MPDEIPPPKFQHYEHVVVRGTGLHSKEFRGERGTVVWLDSFYARTKPDQLDKWMYIVHLPARNCWRTFLQSDLDSEGEFDTETAHLGTRPEISFDTVLKEENTWVEGSYRLPGELWQVVIFQRDDVPEVRCQPSKWD